MNGNVEFRNSQITLDGRDISGVAIPYGETAVLKNGKKERFLPGAFSPIGSVRFDSHHVRAHILARTGAGLEIFDEVEALRFKACIPETQAGNDLIVLVEANVLQGASIEFRALREYLEGRVRVISKALLIAISIVDDPAYQGARLQKRGNRRWRYPLL